MDRKPGRLQVTVDHEARRANKEGKERRRSVLSEESLNAQLRHRPDDIEKVEDL